MEVGEYTKGARSTIFQVVMGKVVLSKMFVWVGPPILNVAQCQGDHAVLLQLIAHSDCLPRGASGSIFIGFN